MIKSAQQ